MKDEKTPSIVLRITKSRNHSIAQSLNPTTRGFVLVCVLWVLAILTVITVGFGRRSMLDRRASAYALDRTQVMMMARGAVQRGIVELRNKVFNDALKPDEGAITHLGQPWARRKNMLAEGLFFDVGEEFKDDIVEYIIEDAESRIDLNSAPKELLEEVDALSRSAVRKLLTQRTRGVHDGEGATPFQAIEELRYMRGVDDDDWFGTRRKTGLKYLVTTMGGGRINANTASREVLECIPKLGDSAVSAILNYRAGQDSELGTGDDQGLKNWDDLADTTGVRGDDYDALRAHCKFTSSCFKITGIATLRKGTVRARCSAMVTVAGSEANIVQWQEEAFGT